MKAELVFNDLSVRKASSTVEAWNWFSDMMETVADLIDEEVCLPVLHTNLDLYGIDLIPDEYGFQEWVEDTRTDFELRHLAWTLATQNPVQKGLTETGEDRFLRSEFKLDDQKTNCAALGVALLYDGIAVSLPSLEMWLQTQIPFEQWLYDSNLENPQQLRHRVRHASQPHHVDIVIRSWQHSQSRKIEHAEALVTHWKTIYRQLDFCEEYKDKLLPNLQGVTLVSVLKRLWDLDETCRNWSQGYETEPVYPFYARPESSQTMQNKKRAAQRLATCPHQGEQHFLMHCNIEPWGYRMYWLLNRELKRITIGYIGPHLETAKDKGK